MSKHKARPSNTAHNISIKLTAEEFEQLVKGSRRGQTPARSACVVDRGAVSEVSAS